MPETDSLQANAPAAPAWLTADDQPTNAEEGHPAAEHARGEWGQAPRPDAYGSLGNGKSDHGVEEQATAEEAKGQPRRPRHLYVVRLGRSGIGPMVAPPQPRHQERGDHVENEP